MNALAIVKAGTSFIVGVGASRISASIIKNNVPTDNLIDKITVTAGSVVIGWMAADAAKEATGAEIDKFVEGFSKIKESINKAKAHDEVRLTDS